MLNPAETKRPWTIIAFTDNAVGMLHHITILFTRRKVNIDSLTTSESESPGVFRYTLVVRMTRSQAEKVTNQLEKIIGVYKATLLSEEETVFQEIALYKIPTDELTGGDHIEKLVRKHSARILSVHPDFLVIEKTGHKEDTQALLEDLKPYQVLEFVRSGRIAVRKPMKHLPEHLEELEEMHQDSIEEKPDPNA